MPTSASPFETQPPDSRKLFLGIGGALAVATLILVLFVLPAEYGVDPTGFGEFSGLATMKRPKEPTAPIKISDVIGGNEDYRKGAPANARLPTPLPNAAVAQIKSAAAKSERVVVMLKPGEQTEIKAILDTAQVIIYSWTSTGEVYTDFHGHEPDAGEEFVRYEEQQTGHEGHGSLVAPFNGEHGWFWLNIGDVPVTITLDLLGFHKEVKNYGVSQG